MFLPVQHLFSLIHQELEQHRPQHKYLFFFILCLWGLFIWVRSFLLNPWLHRFHKSRCWDSLLKGFWKSQLIISAGSPCPHAHLPFQRFLCGFTYKADLNLMEYSLWKDINYLSSVPHTSSFPGGVTYCGLVQCSLGIQKPWLWQSSELCPNRQWLRLNMMAFYPCSQVFIVSSCGALLRLRIKLPFVCPASLLLFLHIEWKVSRLDWKCQLLMKTAVFPFHWWAIAAASSLLTVCCDLSRHRIVREAPVWGLEFLQYH